MARKTFLKHGVRNVNRQRRNPSAHLQTLLNQKPGPIWFPVAPIVYGCEPAPVTTLAHKHLRILKRLAAGEELRRIGKAWRWLKNSGGKVKDALLRGMQRLGMVKVIGGRWLLTADGLAAVSA